MSQVFDQGLQRLLDNAEDQSVPVSIKELDFDINPDDLFLVGDAFIDEKGLNGHHLESANNFYATGIKQIITEGFDIQKDIVNRRDATPEDKSIDRIHCEVKFTDVKIYPPTTLNYVTGKEIMLMPQVALLREKTYSGPLYIGCEVKATAYLKNGSTIERVDHVDGFRAAKVPIIKGSIMCNTYGKTKEALMQMGEDPSDPGGYFIVKSEWAVDCTESTTFNQEKIYINEGYGKSRVRFDYISKPGDTYQNSEMTILIFNTDNTFSVEISRDKLMNVKIPFYLLFRAMGWSNDKEMLDWIVFDYEADANKNLLNNLIAAMNAKYGKIEYRDMYDQNLALRAIVDLVPEESFKYLDLKNKPQNYANAVADVLSTFDKHFLPHIGLTSDSRHNKLKFLALLIRKVFLVYLRHIPQTDRDSYRIKRIHAAGDNYAKTFKTLFNQTVAMPIKKQMNKIFNSTPFSQVNLANLVKSSIYVDDFERLIVQTIVSGNKSSLKIKRRTVTNRFMAQQLNRKNQLNMYATMRQVSSTSADSAKQSERAQEMRRVHPSAIGYICVVHSPPEGEKVGINKQMAIFASIAPSSSSEVLKKLVLSDSALIPENKPTPIEIYRNNYARVYVNGHLIGYTRNSIDLVNRYRQKRRKLEIHPYTTVYWDNTQDEVQFFVDSGRMTRPLMIVYNRQRDAEVFKDSKDNKQFEQGIAITQEDIVDLFCKRKGIYDLVREQKVEFITPEEQQNCYICANFTELKENRLNQFSEYTHCDIPQAILGITALTAPFGNHNQAPRVTYQTSQSKQTCGFYAGNWPFRIDKETFLQYISEMPLIRTALNKYIYPNGNNCMVAMMCYLGYNQEDSLVINKAAIDRGLFNGSKFTFYKTELEQKEKLGNPDVTKTENIKSANYSKLVNGVVERGTHIHEDDVLIGKFMTVPKGTGRDAKSVYVDRSIVYKDSEEAIVQNVVVDRNEDAMRFAKVGLRKVRPVAIGDKFCLKPSAEVLTNIGWVSLQDLDISAVTVATMNNSFHLSYVRPTEKYIFDYDSKQDGDLVHIESQQILSISTPNHKNYVKKRDSNTFQLIEASQCIGKRLRYKKDCVNNYSDVANKTFTQNGTVYTYPMNPYLKLLGMFISDGWVRDTRIEISCIKQRKIDYINQIATDFGVTFKYYNDKFHIGKTTLPGIFEHFETLSVGALNKRLPSYIWDLGLDNCKALLDGLINGDGSINKSNAICYWTSSVGLADDVQRLCLHAGCSANVTIGHPKGNVTYIKGRKVVSDNDCYSVRIVFAKNEPQMNHGHVHKQNRQIEKLVSYNGQVMCIEVPDTHLFYYRENKLSPPIWTGNSSRAGQKGICAMLLREEDMPVNMSGIHPDIIFNPHGLPSRMTAGQLIESLIANVCAIKGAHYDGTLFKKNDIESFAEILEQYGMNRHGYERMISGVTGEYIDMLVFFGPTFYQRLQKFVSDAEYSVRHALTDALTNQPLDLIDKSKCYLITVMLVYVR